MEAERAGEDIALRFERSGTSTFLGWIVYALLAPVVALLTGFLAAGLTVVATNTAGLSRPVIAVSAITVGIAAAASIVAFAVRDFRRRRAASVVLCQDRLEIDGAAVRFTEIADARFLHCQPAQGYFSVAVLKRSGATVRLNPELAPLASVRPHLERTLLAELVSRLAIDLERGETAHVRDGLGRLLLIPYGLVVALASVPLALASVLPGLHGSTIGPGLLYARQGWYARKGGFRFTRDGLLGAGSRLHPWADVALLRSDRAGVVLESRLSGERFSASPYADRFWVATLWLPARLDDEQTAATKAGGSVELGRAQEAPHFIEWR